MRKAALWIPLIAAVSTSAMAEWSRITSDEQGTNVYVDATTIRRTEGTRTMWSMLDFRETQVVSGVPFKSGRSQKEYDCKKERSRILSMSFHSNNLGLGRTIHTDCVPKAWEPVSPTSIESELFNFVCKTSTRSEKPSRSTDVIPVWKRVHSTQTATAFYDPKSIQRKSGITKMLVMTNFAQPIIIEGKRHQSAKARFEYDCIKKRSRVNGSSYYGVPDGNGAPTGTEGASNDWYSVEPNTMGSALWNIACGK